jgi:hypothetical protein
MAGESDQVLHETEVVLCTAQSDPVAVLRTHMFIPASMSSLSVPACSPDSAWRASSAALRNLRGASVSPRTLVSSESMFRQRSLSFSSPSRTCDSR